MRKVALLLTLVFGLAGVAMAGDYHTGATLICNECHVMHGQQQHSYADDGTGTWVAIGGAAPYHYLLRNEVNQLCLTCHDGGAFVIDVLGATSNTPTNGRNAGALNGLGAANYDATDGHTLGTLSGAPGGGWTPGTHGLECTDCHQQHGYAGFISPAGTSPWRNLLYNSGGVAKAAVTYEVGGTPTNTVDVFERVATFGGDHYSTTNVDYQEPSATASAMGAWCGGCHTNFHGNASSANMRVQTGAAGTEWLRHPTAEANIGGVGGGHSSLTQFGVAPFPKVMDPAGLWDGTGADLTPSCFSCHKGHGNQNAFGLIFGAPTTENGNGANDKALCKECHVQG